jgi:hypothetical protein
VPRVALTLAKARENIIQQIFSMRLIKVELEQQVVDFIRSLPPEPRQALRRGRAYVVSIPNIALVEI